MPPLAGLTGMDQPSQVTDQGVLEAHGGPVDDSHGQYGGADIAYPAAYGSGYHGGSYATVIDQGKESPLPVTGDEIDATPTAHRAPYPRGIQQPDNDIASYAQTADQRIAQRKALHGRDLGGTRALLGQSPAGREIPADYTTDRYDAPNVTALATGIPGQLRGLNGKDTSQGYGELNSADEFARGHSIRRVQHDRMPWDMSLRYAPPQPFWGRHEIVQARFDGEDSPYGWSGDTSTGQQVPWEGRIGYPTTPAAPAEPVTLPASQGEDVWPAW